MLKPNQGHKQKPLLTVVNTLPEAQKKRLEESWAQTFYEEVFCRIDERTFGVLYSDKVSRPNVPVNVLVGLEILKEGFGWTDEQMYDNFCFNVQVRYALGYWNMNEGQFAVRTIYNFRRRLVTHQEETEENLFAACFEQITGEQMLAYEVNGRVQRMDSKQVMSNIAERTRLQLLLEGLHRVYRILSDEDKKKYEPLLASYIKVSSNNYIYQLKGEKHRPHIEKVGVVMHQLVDELGEKYGEERAYKVLARLVDEHFKTVETETDTETDKEVEIEIVPKEGDELSADSLQSVDDLDATYRKKDGVGYKGYVANVTETVDDEGGLNLITKVQVEPNVTDDAAMLNDALPDLAELTNVKQMITDGGYNCADVDKTCAKLGVELHQTAIRGQSPNPHKPHLSHFTITDDEDGQPHTATCPHGKSVPIEAGQKEGRYIIRLSHKTCPACASLAQTDKPPEQAACVLYFNRHDLNVARRRQRSIALLADGRNPRAAVESTVREVSCRWANSKLRVRTLIRVSMTVIAAATMVNARRIWRSQQRKNQEMIPNYAKTAAIWRYIQSKIDLFSFHCIQTPLDTLYVTGLFLTFVLLQYA